MNSGKKVDVYGKGRERGMLNGGKEGSTGGVHGEKGVS